MSLLNRLFNKTIKMIKVHCKSKYCNYHGLSNTGLTFYVMKIVTWKLQGFF